MAKKKTWHEEHIEMSTLGQRLADMVANGMGSWKFIIIQTIFVITWMGMNLVGYLQHWDPYPFILLNLLFSTQAAYAAPIIMMSQNRQSDRDRAQAQPFRRGQHRELARQRFQHLGECERTRIGPRRGFYGRARGRVRGGRSTGISARW